MLGSFGILHPTKCNVEAVEAFAGVASRHPTALLMFVGRDLGEGETLAKAASLGIQERIRFFGHAPLDAFRDLAAVTDIGVNLRRPPTNGETSGALLSLLSAGVPAIVIDVDTFSGYPDDVVRKVSWSPQLVPDLQLRDAGTGRRHGSPNATRSRGDESRANASQLVARRRTVRGSN